MTIEMEGVFSEENMRMSMDVIEWMECGFLRLQCFCGQEMS